MDLHLGLLATWADIPGCYSDLAHITLDYLALASDVIRYLDLCQLVTQPGHEHGGLGQESLLGVNQCRWCALRFEDFSKLGGLASNRVKLALGLGIIDPAATVHLQHPLTLRLFRRELRQVIATLLLEAGRLRHLLAQLCPCLLEGGTGIENELAALLPNSSF
ncbi:MAG: hypothetical protein KY456_08485 [Chloroflexi bacterium]|nr:hypothetical protein [Chloroflexota bacterium]